MSKRILITQGHPDASQPHLCHALASSYNVGVQSAGHTVKHLKVAELDFPLLRSQMAPVNEMQVGLTGNMNPAEAGKWQAKLKRLGERAE